MKCKTKPLGTLCTVKTGLPVSRLAAKNGEQGSTLSVLTPRSIEGGRIDDAEIAVAENSIAKDEYLTRGNDVIVKTTTPYSCALIDHAHKGIVIASFALILRSLGDNVDMRYLAAFLSSPQANETLRETSKGKTLKLVKKKDLEELPVPVPPISEQRTIGRVFQLSLQQKEACRRIMNGYDQLVGRMLSESAFDD